MAVSAGRVTVGLEGGDIAAASVLGEGSTVGSEALVSRGTRGSNHSSSAVESVASTRDRVLTVLELSGAGEGRGQTTAAER